MITFLAIIGVLAIIIFILDNINAIRQPKLNESFPKALESHNRGDYHESIRILNELLNYYPRDYKIINNRGNSKYKLGWFEEALNDFNKSIEINPDPEKNVVAYMNKEKALAALRWDNGFRTSLIDKMLED